MLTCTTLSTVMDSRQRQRLRQPAHWGNLVRVSCSKQSLSRKRQVLHPQRNCAGARTFRHSERCLWGRRQASERPRECRMGAWPRCGQRCRLRTRPALTQPEGPQAPMQHGTCCWACMARTLQECRQALPAAEVICGILSNQPAVSDDYSPGSEMANVGCIYCRRFHRISFAE